MSMTSVTHPLASPTVVARLVNTLAAACSAADVARVSNWSAMVRIPYSPSLACASARRDRKSLA
jgi:hypothetical protein